MKFNSDLTRCMLRNFSCFCSHLLAIFSKSTFSKDSYSHDSISV